jgi:hypothetical protein
MKHFDEDALANGNPSPCLPLRDSVAKFTTYPFAIIVLKGSE